MLFGWGANSHGQLGLGHKSEQENRPKHVNCSTVLCQVSGGGGHTLAVDKDGTLFVCGWNRFGQLGLGHTEDVTVFTCTGVRGVKAAVGGWDFSIVLLEDGRVLSAGANKYLQLGVKDKSDKVGGACDVLTEVEGLRDIVEVAAGLRHAAAVDKDGRLFTWGLGSKGQLGRHTEGDVDLPGPVEGLQNIVSVSCGQYYTLVITREGNLFGFGQNKFCQISKSCEKSIFLPRQLAISGVASVSCGWTHVSTLSSSLDHTPGGISSGGTSTTDSGDDQTTGGRSIGGLYHAWGRNNYHQCAQAGKETIVALDQQKGSLLADQLVKKVLSGSEHCLCLDVEGKVFAWGWNEHGNCGTGTTEDIPEPTQIEFPSSHYICDIFVGSAHCFAMSD